MTKKETAKISAINKIRLDIEVPKSRRNVFGKFDYRNVGDIYKALKPLLATNQVEFEMLDAIVMKGDRFYVETTVKITDSDGLTTSAVGNAREDDTKKGMSADQITGATTSYARKSALEALLLLDEHLPDSDTDEPKRATRATITAAEAKSLKSALAKAGADEAAFMKWGNCSSLRDLPAGKLGEAKRMIAAKLKESAK